MPVTRAQRSSLLVCAARLCTERASIAAGVMAPMQGEVAGTRESLAATLVSDLVLALGITLAAPLPARAAMLTPVTFRL